MDTAPFQPVETGSCHRTTQFKARSWWSDRLARDEKRTDMMGRLESGLQQHDHNPVIPTKHTHTHIYIFIRICIRM